MPLGILQVLMSGIPAYHIQRKFIYPIVKLRKRTKRVTHCNHLAPGSIGFQLLDKALMRTRGSC